MSLLRKFCIVTILFPLIICIPTSKTNATEDGSSTLLTIERAETALLSAYQAVQRAEKNEANVSSLVRRLNDALLFLDRANSSMNSGNFSGVGYLAERCYEICEEINSKAHEIEERSIKEADQKLHYLINLWLISIFIIVCGSFVIWRGFVKHYYRKTLKMIPEVTDQSDP